MRTKLQQLRSIYNSKGVNKTAKLHEFSPRQSTTTVAEVKDTQLEKAAQSEPLVSTVVSSSDVEDTRISRLKMSLLLEEKPPPVITLKAYQPRV